MKKAKPNIQVIKGQGHLLPVTAYDAEEIEFMSDGSLFTLKPEKKRSPPQHKLYWQILNKAVQVTNKWATSEHLHNDLKMLCGHYKATLNAFTGDVYYTADSTAYEKMTQDEFNKYFETALEKLSTALEFDPMELLEN